ncbi:MAG TPA: glycosyltransferase family 39 protein [Gemmatimonadaceae bacterium]
MPSAIAVVTIAALVRLAVAATVPLVPDETYYWEWSRHLAAGYFDHPGAIAFLVRAGTELAGVTPFGVRLGSVIAGWGASLCLVLLARRIGGDDAALRAAVIITCMPLAAAGLVLATPDAPLLLAVSAALLLLDHAVAAAPGSARSLGWWLAAGLALGAAMVSKYNAFLLPLGVLVALLLSAQLRRHLATPAPYLAALVALVAFAPVVAWNASHGWISFRFQLSHGLAHGDGSALAREASLIGGQIGLVSPILFALIVLMVGRALVRGTPRQTLLAVVAATVFLFCCVSALARPAEANWQAIAYVPATVLLATYSGGRIWRGWLGAACALGATFVVLLYLQAFSPFLPIAAGRDPTARGVGYDVLAASVAQAASTAGRSVNAGHSTWIAANRYQDASELAFHLAEHPLTFSLNIASRPNQYDLWPSFARHARAGDDLVIALPVPHSGADQVDPVIQVLRPHFGRTRLWSTVRITRGRDTLLVRRIWVLGDYRGIRKQGNYRGIRKQGNYRDQVTTGFRVQGAGIRNYLAGWDLSPRSPF